MMQGQVFLKGGGVFLRFIIFTFRKYFTFAKLCYAIAKKKKNFCYHSLVLLFLNVIPSCLKMNLKVSQKLT